MKKQRVNGKKDMSDTSFNKSKFAQTFINAVFASTIGEAIDHNMYERFVALFEQYIELTIKRLHLLVKYTPEDSVDSHDLNKIIPSPGIFPIHNTDEMKLTLQRVWDYAYYVHDRDNTKDTVLGLPGKFSYQSERLLVSHNAFCQYFEVIMGELGIFFYVEDDDLLMFHHHTKRKFRQICRDFYPSKNIIGARASLMPSFHNLTSLRALNSDNESMFFNMIHKTTNVLIGDGYEMLDNETFFFLGDFLYLAMDGICEIIPYMIGGGEVSSTIVKEAFSIITTGEISQCIQGEIDKSVKKNASRENKERWFKANQTNKFDITDHHITIGQLNAHVHNILDEYQFSIEALIALAAGLDYLAAEIIELSFQMKVRINSSELPFISLDNCIEAIHEDEELTEMFVSFGLLKCERQPEKTLRSGEMFFPQVDIDHFPEKESFRFIRKDGAPIITEVASRHSDGETFVFHEIFENEKTNDFSLLAETENFLHNLYDTEYHNDGDPRIPEEEYDDEDDEETPHFMEYDRSPRGNFVPQRLPSNISDTLKTVRTLVDEYKSSAETLRDELNDANESIKAFNKFMENFEDHIGDLVEEKVKEIAEGDSSDDERKQKMRSKISEKRTYSAARSVAGPPPSSHKPPSTNTTIPDTNLVVQAVSSLSGHSNVGTSSGFDGFGIYPGYHPYSSPPSTSPYGSPPRSTYSSYGPPSRSTYSPYVSTVGTSASPPVAPPVPPPVYKPDSK